jgi:glycolate oxidase iron-sulfur subunit
MQTSFSLEQLADPDVAESEKILRACVHCGFCTATCPTYVLDGNELDSPRGRIYLIKDMLENDRPASAEVALHIDRCLSCLACMTTCPTYVLDGNELDSPRGRIYLIKDMLENDRPASAEVALHIDRCLSCLACMTTCPSGVHYMHLVDHARVHIEETYTRPTAERLLRELLARLLPYPQRFRVALAAALLAKPLTGLAEAIGLKRLAAMLRLAPWGGPHAPLAPQTFAVAGPARRARVALLAGCVNDVLAPQINAAAVRALTRYGVEVVVAKNAGCCGSLVHHMGREEEALAQARANIDAWTALGDIDAIVITASGCGTTVKDYGFMLRTDPVYRERAGKVVKLARDIAEYLATLPLDSIERPPGLVVAYHSACSLQHGQRITRQPKELLAKLGFVVKDIPEGHLCCGSAGTYNIMQPDLARRLRERKVGTIERLRPDVIAAGNIGCITQIGAGTRVPTVHTVELIDWASGGPRPPALLAHRGQTAELPYAAAG